MNRPPIDLETRLACEVIASGRPAGETCLDRHDAARRQPSSCWPAGLVAGRLLCRGCLARRHLRDINKARALRESHVVD